MVSAEVKERDGWPTATPGSEQPCWARRSLAQEIQSEATWLWSFETPWGLGAVAKHIGVLG